MSSLSGRNDGTISDYIPVNTGVRQGCVLAPTLFNTCVDHVLGRMSENSGCGMSFENVRITDLDFADDAVIFAETTDVLAGALDSPSEEGGRAAWIASFLDQDQGPGVR